MSGIAGILRLDGGPASINQIQRITSRMATRGPDGINHFISESVALGHCMLRTTSWSHKETQPLVDAESGTVVVLDGRIDNRDELIADLRARKLLRTDTGDANIVLAAYNAWKRKAPEQLLGSFAFAIWDKREGTLFCARDQLGVKPFYFTQNPKYFAFASVDEALIEPPYVNASPNELRIAMFLATGGEGNDPASSWIENVQSIAPGQWLAIDRSGNRQAQHYWRLEPRDELRLKTDEEYIEAFESIFQKTVDCRLQTIGPPALMLSGGIDSASIAGAAWKLRGGPEQSGLHTFSVIDTRKPEKPETSNIRDLTSSTEQTAYFLELPSLKGPIELQDLVDATTTFSHPISNSILLPAMMYRAASRFQFRTILDGVDGDMVTYTPNIVLLLYIAQSLAAGRLLQAWEMSKLASRNNAFLKQHSPISILTRGIWHKFAPVPFQNAKRLFQKYLKSSSILNNLLDPELALKHRIDERIHEWNTHLVHSSSGDHQKVHLWLLQNPGIAPGLEAFDRIAGNYGIEPSHPWSDLRMVNFFLNLPLQQKTRNGWTKYLVRKAAAKWIKPSVSWHTGKDHYGWTLTHQLLINDRENTLQSLSEARSQLKGYVPPKVISQLQNTFASQPADAELEHIFQAISLSRWLTRLKSPSQQA